MTTAPTKRLPPPLPPRAGLPGFSEDALRFLRGLARNNRREWFEPRRELFEQQLKAPMLALIGEITLAMAGFAPAHVRPPEKSLLRIYRDTRFSPDKRPYKTHLAAWWASAGMPRTSGAGYYLHLSATEVHIAAGLYMPTSAQLRALRTRLLESHAAFRRLLRAPTLNRLFTPDPGHPLTRPPKGFPAGHPALDLLLPTRWGFSASLPAAAILDQKFPREVLRRYRAARPLVDFLNASLTTPNTTQNPAQTTPFTRTRPAFFPP